MKSYTLTFWRLTGALPTRLKWFMRLRFVAPLVVIALVGGVVHPLWVYILGLAFGGLWAVWFAALRAALRVMSVKMVAEVSPGGVRRPR